MNEDTLNKLPILEDWQIEALAQLLTTPVLETGEKSRVLVTNRYGDSFHHIVTSRYDCVQIDQIDIDATYQQKVKFYPDELPGLLHILLTWYLADQKPKKKTEDSFLSSDDDSLGDLDDHPF